jgi:hypothetical protein
MCLLFMEDRFIQLDIDKIRERNKLETYLDKLKYKFYLIKFFYFWYLNWFKSKKC